MKKVSLICVCAFICFSVLLSGCDAKTQNKPDPFHASCEWDVTKGNLRFCYTTEAASENAKLVFSEPETLSGLEIRFTDGALFAFFDGLETPVSRQFISEIIPFCDALNALRNADTRAETPVITENGVTYRAYRDTDGNISRIEVKGEDWTSENFEVLSVRQVHDDTESESSGASR